MELIIGRHPVGPARVTADKEGSATIVTRYREWLAPSSHPMPSGMAFFPQWQPGPPADVEDRCLRSPGYAAVGRQG